MKDERLREIWNGAISVGKCTDAEIVSALRRVAQESAKEERERLAGYVHEGRVGELALRANANKHPADGKSALVHSYAATMLKSMEQAIRASVGADEVAGRMVGSSHVIDEKVRDRETAASVPQPQPEMIFWGETRDCTPRTAELPAAKPQTSTGCPLCDDKWSVYRNDNGFWHETTAGRVPCGNPKNYRDKPQPDPIAIVCQALRRFFDRTDQPVRSHQLHSLAAEIERIAKEKANG